MHNALFYSFVVKFVICHVIDIDFHAEHVLVSFIDLIKLFSKSNVQLTSTYIVFMKFNKSQRIQVTMSFLSVVVLCCISSTSNAQLDTAAVKNSYWLFKPTPEALLRDEIGADRPDETESPYTIDAGHFMYETDLFKYERENNAGVQQTQYLFHEANFKFGITNKMDFQVKIQSYGIQREREASTGAVTRSAGFGDISLRLKHNLYGNDHGHVAVGTMAYVKIPTNEFSDNQSWEGGIIFPVEIKLPNEWKLGVQIEGDRLKDSEGENMHTELLQSAVISHPVFKHFNAYAETYYTYDFKGHEWKNFVNAALQYEASKKVMFDAGVYYGLQAAASKSYFIGLLVEI